MSQAIRVVVVDDSALMRNIIIGLLEQDPDIRVVGSASNGLQAIELVQTLRPDLVTMDVRMPVMDGLETTKHLMAYCPTPILVLTASLARYDVDISFQMLEAGALEVIEKPSGGDSHALERASRALIKRIKVLARIKVVTHLRGRRKPPAPFDPAIGSGAHGPAATPARFASTPARRPLTAANPPAVPVSSDVPLIVIGASTGGPRVVNALLASLPRDLAAAVLVVQHIAHGFSAGLAEWLANASKLPIALAREGQRIGAGEVLVAPDAYDLLITSARTVHLSHNSLLIQHPSIDISMQAVAEIYGARAIGVLLTGMGRDGANGMVSIKRANGYTIAQDEATSAIFGMPRAAIQLGAAHEVLPAPQIAPRLIALVKQLTNAADAQRKVGA